MSIDLDNWLAVEQMMEEENHILLQPGTPETETQQQPQLLVISSYAANGSSSPATFSLIVLVGGDIQRFWHMSPLTSLISFKEFVLLVC
jgi:hypothetical protein